MQQKKGKCLSNARTNDNKTSKWTWLVMEHHPEDTRTTRRWNQMIWITNISFTFQFIKNIQQNPKDVTKQQWYHSLHEAKLSPRISKPKYKKTLVTLKIKIQAYTHASLETIIAQKEFWASGLLELSIWIRRIKKKTWKKLHRVFHRELM